LEINVDQTVRLNQMLESNGDAHYQRWPSFKTYLQYTVVQCSSNHGHTSCKWNVLMTGQSISLPLNKL